jgi:hypothetical protein
MTSRLRKNAIVLMAIMMGATACNLPASVAPSVSNPTPDLTITALFEFITTAQSAQTATPVPPTQPPVVQASATPSVTPPPISTTAPTAVPTNTEEPSAGEESISGSSGGGTGLRSSELVAYYFQDEPTIDGDFDEDVWDQDRYAVDHVVYGDDHVSGSNDLSGTVMVGWDDYFLYIAARVKDDRYVQNASGKNLFKGDSIEIMLDTNLSRDLYRRSLDGDDYQLGISPGKSEPSEDTEAYLWYPRSKDGTYDDVKAAAVPTDDGYRIEAKIPWSLYSVNPDIGKHYGFAFSISDNDRSGENVQQSMVSTAPDRHLTDPTTWGELTLEGHQ